MKTRLFKYFVAYPLAIIWLAVSIMPTYDHWRGVALTKLCAVKAAEDETRIAQMMGELAKVKIPALALPDVGM